MTYQSKKGAVITGVITAHSYGFSTMIDANTLPGNLASRANDSYDDASEWTALVADGAVSKIFRWSLDPGQPFGSDDLAHWATRIVARHDYPVRIQWRLKTGSLLHDQTLWGPENGDAREGGFAAMVPDLGMSGASLDVEPTTPLERLLTMIMEQPEVAANAFRTIIEPFLRRSEQRDAELIRVASEYSAKAAASAAAAAVEQKLAQMAMDAGYDVDENGNIIDDFDADQDEDAAEAPEREGAPPVAVSDDHEQAEVLLMRAYDDEKGVING